MAEYTLLRELKSDVVWLAHMDGQEVVLKLEFEQRERPFLDAVQHPDIVRCLGEFDEDAGRANLDHYLVLEYIPGVDLKALRSGGPFASEIFSYYAGKLVNIIGHVHERGIVHNDIKPNNLMDTGDMLKLFDFNLAKYVSVQRMEICGTYGYASLEQIRGLNSFSNDLFGLGATLFYLKEGKRVYDLSRFNGHDLQDYEAILQRGPSFRISGNVENEMIMALVERDARNRPLWSDVQKTFPLMPVP
jgi:serine/threonine protein kinase